MSRHDGKVWVRKLRSRYSTHPWEVRARDHGGYDYYETFFTWSEALDYADRLARTIEVTLPRISHSGDWVPNMPTLKIGWEHHPVETSFWVEDRGINSIYVRPDELRPLALALLALAEKENT